MAAQAFCAALAEANAAYARHAGIPNVVGQKLREMVGDEADAWAARYGHVLRVTTAMNLVPLAIGALNDGFQAGPQNTAGYAPGMWFYTALAAVGLWFAWRLWRLEARPANT